MDHIKDDISIKSPPKLIDISGLKTMIHPINPTHKAIILLNLIYSFKKTIANNVVKIGTDKFNAVT